MNNTDKEGMQHTKVKLGVFLKKMEKQRNLGRYIRSTDRQVISEEGVFVWLLNGDTTADTESVILTANDQTLQHKCHATEILQTKIDRKCKFL
jgi:hypothetical protein